VFSEGFVDQVYELQAQIEAYLGLQRSKPQAQPAEPALREEPPEYRET